MSTSGFVYLPPREITPIFNADDYIYTPITFRPVDLTLTTLRFEASGGNFYVFKSNPLVNALVIEKQSPTGATLSLNTTFVDDDLFNNRSLNAVYFKAKDGAYTADVNNPNFAIVMSNAKTSGLYMSNRNNGTLKLCIENTDKVTFGPNDTKFVDHIHVPQGSAGVPGVTFVGAATSGVFLTGGGSVGLSTNGVERMSVGTEVLSVAHHPTSDNTQQLGKSGARWSEVWAAKGTINTSDSTLKDSVPLTYGLNEVLQMKPILYQWKDVKEDDPTYGFKYMGFNAQELRDLYPELVYDEDPNSPLGLNYCELIAVLTKAIQELKRELNELRERIP